MKNISNARSSIPVSQNPLLFFGLVVVLLGLVGSIGWFEYRHQFLLMRVAQLEQESNENLNKATPPELILQEQPLPSPSDEKGQTFKPESEVFGWEIFSNTEHSFAFHYPPEATVTYEKPYTKVSLWGPTQKKATEVYDGLSLRFKEVSLSGKKIEDIMNMQLARSSDLGTVLVEPHKIKLNGLSGYKFTVKGLGIHTHFYLISPSRPNTLIIVIDSTSDPTHQGYEQTVQNILSTLSIN